MTASFLILILILAAVGMVWLNITHYRQRRAMTPEERKRDDDEMRDDLFIW